MEHLRKFVQNEEWDDFINAIVLRCATDLEAFALIFFSHYCKHEFNLFHRNKMDQYDYGERSVRRADAAPRGYAKSTIKVLIKPIHDVCYQLEKFIIIASNTHAQSVQKLKDIKAEFINNELLTLVYGSHFPSGKVSVEDFVCRLGSYSCRFLAVGADTEIRGARHGDSRPSKVILDDIEHSEEVESEELRDKMLHWFQDVISKIGDENTNIEFVGTVLHQKSLLKHLLQNPRYETGEYKAVISWSERQDLWDQWTQIYTNLDNDYRLDDAKKFYEENRTEMDRGVEVLWPEKEPYYYLMEEIIETGMRSFMKEKQNSPMSDGEKTFAPENIWWYEERKDGLFVLKSNTLVPWNQLSAYGAIDPSTGQQKASARKKMDFTCILTGYHQPARSRLFVHHDYTRRIAPSVYIKEIFELNERFKYNKFAVETNLYRNLLTQNIQDEKKRREAEFKKSIDIRFYDVEQTENKEKRIYTLEPKVYHGHILFNKNGISQEFMNQLYDFPKGNHDDCPDSLEMLWGLVNNKYKVGGLRDH